MSKKEKREWERYWDLHTHENYNRGQRIRERTRKSHEAIAREVNRVGGSVLDIGCGTGVSSEYILKKVRYVGIDITEKFIRAAKKYYPSTQFMYGNTLNIPFPDRSFETVFSKSLIDHLHPDDIQRHIQEMARIARKQVLICFWLRPTDEETRIEKRKNLYINRYNKQEIIHLIKSLDRFKSLNIIEKNMGPRKDALYVITLKD